MNLTNSSSITKNSDQLPLKGKARAAQYYLYLVGLYIILVFNEFISKPVDCLALVLIVVGVPLISQKNIQVLKASITQSITVKIFTYSLLIMSTLFLLATSKQLPEYGGLIAFAAQYGVHIGLAVVALMIIPLNKNSANAIFNFLFISLISLVLTDIVFYIWQWINHISIAGDYSHRWLGDGYVFLTPFLLAHMLSGKIKPNAQNKAVITRPQHWVSLGLWLLLGLIIILCGATGARSTYIAIALELFCFIGIQAYQDKWSWQKIWLAIVFSSFCFSLLFSLLSPSLFTSAVNRKLQISDRIEFAWGPGLSFLIESPWLGYGFGRQAWDSAFKTLMVRSPNIINFGSTHNWFLAAGFFGGVLAIIAQVVLSVSVCVISLRFIKGVCKRGNQYLVERQISCCMLAVLGSFVTFYLVRGLVEFTIYKYLSITVMSLILCYLIYSQKKDENQ
jgi:hypothetical protein